MRDKLTSLCGQIYNLSLNVTNFFEKSFGKFISFCEFISF